MTYEVVLTDTVRDAIEAQILFYKEEGVALDVISNWLAKLMQRIEDLYEMPHRYPISEIVTAVSGLETRRLNHGENALYYRVDEKAKRVEIIAFRHGRRRPGLG
ncbi:MAG: type II toxin-antitoxin system RelE/ParE family toxin [Planctomycetota bacterium]